MARHRAARRAPRPVPRNQWLAWAFDAAERSVRAYAGAFASLVAADQAFTKFDLALQETFAAAFVGFIVSALFSLAGKTRGAPDSASLSTRPVSPFPPS